MKDENDYEVGYGKPPKHTRFKKGQTGNRHGRPKKHKNLGESLDEELRRKIELKGEKMSMQELFIKALVQNAVKGKPAAMKAVLDYLTRFDGQDQTEDFDPKAEDQAALQKWIKKLEHRYSEEDDV